MAAAALKLVQDHHPPPGNPNAAQDAEDWLAHAPTAYLLCRNRHGFPKLAVNPKTGKLPKGVRVYAVGPDLHEVHAPCRDCGLPLVQVIRGGDPTAVVDKWYDYKALPGYLQPKGSSAYINADDCRREAATRGNLHAALKAAARKPLGA
jgi:hypothetical protein